jgi:hypothetical protein
MAVKAVFVDMFLKKPAMFPSQNEDRQDLNRACVT